MQINWYPGHMAKSKRLLITQLGRVDVVVELCDARIPHASRNPDLDKLIANKKRVLILNKADLADSSETAKWLERFKKQGLMAASYVSTTGKIAQALNLIDKAAKEAVQRAADKGVRKVVRVMVVGVPNVGKSTFINHLHGAGIAKTGDRPGVTRSNQWVKIGPYLEILDTPGLLWPRLDDQLSAKRLCYIGTIRDEVVDLHALAISLLDDIMRVRPESVMERYKVKDKELRGFELLEAVCRGRGFLLKGGLLDLDRGCAVVLDEFRAGKLGRITLEPEAEEKTQSLRRLIINAGAETEEDADGEINP